ncbi:MAG: XdhC family protein [Pyrinomonadaceae bacterium]
MYKEFYEHVLEMMRRRRPFALATVVAVRGSSSAKPGSKAIIDETGRNVLGWIGGGCAQSFVCEEARRALDERRTRLVTADLEDEILGLGMPCGGFMDIYIEPVFPRPRLVIAGRDDATTDALPLLADMAGFEVVASDTRAGPFAFEAGDYLLAARTDEALLHVVRRALSAGVRYAGLPEGLLPNCRYPFEKALGIVVELLALERGKTGRPLSVVEETASCVEEKASCDAGRAARDAGRAARDAGRAASESSRVPKLVITGHSRITEELARLGELFQWPTTVNDPSARPDAYSARTCVVSQDPDFARLAADPRTYVVVASHHKGDHLAILKALGEGACYVGLVASRKRSDLILDDLARRGARREWLARFHAPAGLDVGAVAPSEIALSIMAEMLAVELARRPAPPPVDGSTHMTDDVAVGA